jgi:hypothetical protein
MRFLCDLKSPVKLTYALWSSVLKFLAILPFAGYLPSKSSLSDPADPADFPEGMPSARRCMLALLA